MGKSTFHPYFHNNALYCPAEFFHHFLSWTSTFGQHKTNRKITHPRGHSLYFGHFLKKKLSRDKDCTIPNTISSPFPVIKMNQQQHQLH
jgi:hypothetical protein